MMTLLTGATPTVAAAAAPPVRSNPAPAATVSGSATLAPDTVTISSAGRQAAQAAGDADQDGDSH